MGGGTSLWMEERTVHQFIRWVYNDLLTTKKRKELYCIVPAAINAGQGVIVRLGHTQKKRSWSLCWYTHNEHSTHHAAHTTQTAPDRQT